MKHETKIIIITIVVFLLLIFSVYSDSKKKFYCEEYYEIVSILEVRYRDATILLSNGVKVTVNQPSLAIGDNFCVKGYRK